jgi:cation diffusion facilitator CzcD-associated flavoprotein CzcO
MATGCLSSPKEIDIAGNASFKGETYRTSSWPEQDVDFTGKGVAVIGTKQAKHVHVYQRTAAYAVPSGDRAFSEEDIKNFKAKYAELRAGYRNTFFGVSQYLNRTATFGSATPEERQKIYQDSWYNGGWSLINTFADYLLNQEANNAVSDFIKSKVRSIVKDPQTAEDLCPTDYGFALKRACLESGYFEAFNRPNVTLVNLRRTPLVMITPKGIKTAAGEQEFDWSFCAMGFDAIVGSLSRIDIHGRNGETVEQHWSQAISSYLGLDLNNFPNMFTITGPGSPSVLSNMVFSIEWYADWIANYLSYLQKNNVKTIEATRQSVDEWTGVSTTLRILRCSRPSNTPGTTDPTLLASPTASFPTSQVLDRTIERSLPLPQQTTIVYFKKSQKEWNHEP